MPSADQLAALLDLYGIGGRLRGVYERLARVARATAADAPVRLWFSGYLEAEAAAHTIRVWQPLIVHGLFQTEAYAAALFTAMGMTPEQVGEQVELRMRRQVILARPHPPNITLVMWEPVLHHLIGAPEVMRDQVTRLVELSQSIVIQVVPAQSGGNAGLGGAISVVEGPRGAVLLAEALLEDRVTQDQDVVVSGTARFDAVRGGCAPENPKPYQDHGGERPMEQQIATNSLWRKSSYSSGNGGACVEVAAADAVLVRDTTNRGGFTLSVPAGAWTAFMRTLR